MLKPGFAVDAALRDLVAKARLPDSVALLEFAAATASRADWDRICGGAEGGEGTICLGALLAPGQEQAGAALAALLPEALREDALFFVTKANLPALADWCWRRMALLLGAALSAQAASQLASATLRAHTAELEHALALAEASFADFRKEPLRLGLQLEPGFVYAEPPSSPPDEPSRLELRQDIAVPLGNVILLDLFFAQAGNGAPGHGRLTVAAAHSGALLCNHEFDLADIVQGWNRFACIPEATRRKQPLRLGLSLHAPRQIETKPGLAAPLPDPALCARIEGGTAFTRPLAMRVWCGIAGLRYPRQIGILGPAEAPPASAAEILSLPAELVATASLCQAGRETPDFSPVSYEAETQSLLVHPLGRIPTVARVARVKVNGLTGLAALAQLRHFEAQPADFALFAQPSSQTTRFDATLPLNWLHLQAGEWGDVRCTLPEPLTGLVDIFLLTRNQTDDSHLSWAFFRGLQLVCKG